MPKDLFDSPKKAKPPGVPFTKGNQAAKLPRSPAKIQASKDKKALKKLGATEVKECIELVLRENRSGIQRLARDKRSSALHVWIARIVEKAVQHGSTEPLEILLNRTVGKVADKHEHTGRDGGPINSVNTFLALSPEERQKEIEKLRQERLALGDD